MKKLLAVAIIVLFIGVGIQPAFAVVTDQSIFRKEIEECSECNGVSDIDLITLEREITKLFFTIKIIQIIFRNHPEIQEMSNELLVFMNSDGIIWDMICVLIINFVETLVEIRETYFGDAGYINWWLTVLLFSTYQFWKAYFTNQQSVSIEVV